MDYPNRLLLSEGLGTVSVVDVSAVADGGTCADGCSERDISETEGVNILSTLDGPVLVESIAEAPLRRRNG